MLQEITASRKHKQRNVDCHWQCIYLCEKDAQAETPISFKQLVSDGDALSKKKPPMQDKIRVIFKRN